MQQDKTFLGTEPVGQLLRRLAIPTVIAQLVNMLYNIVDRIYIGHIPEAVKHAKADTIRMIGRHTPTPVSAALPSPGI